MTVTHPPAGRAPRPTGPRTRARAVDLLRLFVTRVFADPIRSGRLRDVGWPQGLRVLVVLAASCFVVGVAIVVGSSRLREWLPIGVPNTVGFSMPRPLLWLVLTLVLVSVALLQTAALHGARWFRVLGLLGTIVVMGSWGIRGTHDGSLLSSATTILLIIVLLVLAITRARRTFVWWEFPVVLALVGGSVIGGLVSIGYNERQFGFDFGPVLLQQSLQVMGEFALPAAIAAGTAVAELTVSATLVATRISHRYAMRRTAFLVLAGVLLLRLVQSAWEIVRLDPYRHDLRTVLGSVLGVLLVALVAGALLRLAHRHGRAIRISDLTEDLSRLALPVGAALMLVVLPLLVFSFLVQVVVILDPTGTVGRLPFDWNDLSGTVTTMLPRLLLAVALLVLAIRSARRGQSERAVLFGCIGMLLVLRSSNFLTRGALPDMTDLDVFNLVATAVTVVVAGVLVVRRRLTGERALGLAGLLVLSALFAHRDFVSDPLGAVLGFSGAALVLFGLCWDFLTGCEVGNQGSVRFPLPTRVMLLSANFLFGVTVLAFVSLVRDPDATLSLEDFATLGDELLGTALLVAAVAGVLSAVRGQRSVN